ncbi:ntA domain-containing protein [Trichonephila clavata]|uniref:NtA domain-containing protein n=1 Tax=Trichonephila clavata TaxID=2740835 RepID=A0A8X6FID9_TRICU|nr:ntA domain-containing protein [Trichonephila clavata]
MDHTASMVFTGTVEKLYRSRLTTYRGVVKVKRVVKGDTSFSDNTVIVEGFGDPNICHSDVRERDTRIFLVSLLDNGHLRLNSSVVRVTVSNLDKAVEAVRGNINTCGLMMIDLLYDRTFGSFWRRHKFQGVLRLDAIQVPDRLL